MMRRIAAIVRTDMLVRFRRLSTIVVFMLLSASVFFWIPDARTGRTVMQIGGARVLYNSAAIGMSSASLASIFVGLFGYYVVSNAIRRDVDSRCGFVIASTSMRTHEYLFGKFLGNVVFLTTFMTGFMLAAMAMLVVRAEAPLEPLVFARQYAIMVPSTIVFVSVLAIVFESIPWLSGRIGDVAYFFFWAAGIGIVVNAIEEGATWARWLDFNAFGYLFEYTQKTWHTKHLSIGQSRFDPSKPPLAIEGLRLTGDWLATRIVSTIAPIPLLGIGQLFFHRFDPARVRASKGKGRRSLFRLINDWSRPLVRPFGAVAALGGHRSSFGRAVLSDAMLTIAAMPALGLVTIGFAIAALAAGLRAAQGRNRRGGDRDRRRRIARAPCRHDGTRLRRPGGAREIHRLEGGIGGGDLPRHPRDSALAGDRREALRSPSAGLRRHLHRRLRDGARRDQLQPQDVHRAVPHPLVRDGQRQRGESFGRLRGAQRSCDSGRDGGLPHRRRRAARRRRVGASAAGGGVDAMWPARHAAAVGMRHEA